MYPVYYTVPPPVPPGRSRCADNQRRHLIEEKKKVRGEMIILVPTRTQNPAVCVFMVHTLVIVQASLWQIEMGTQVTNMRVLSNDLVYSNRVLNGFKF
jgi:hypothetical protein